MRNRLTSQTLAAWLAAAIAVVIVAMPFHALLTVWVSSFAGHYTALRLWKECLLAVLVGGVVLVLAKDPSLRRRLAASWLARLIGLYIAVQIAWGIAAYALGNVALPALLYGWASDTRYVLFFLVAWVVAAKVPWLHAWWARLVFWPAAVVIIIGLLQYFVLPYDFMAHLGYGNATIFPYETINHNIAYIRVMSSLRGANPLGAYLVVVLGLFTPVMLTQGRQLLQPRKRRVLAVGGVFVAFGALVLALTFSRSAWIGLGIALVCMVWASLRSRKARVYALVIAALCTLLSSGIVLLLRDDTTFQNVFFHTQTRSAVQTTSNEAHVAAFQQGARDVATEPLGRGPGTAGPASLYNTGHPGRIAENYFLQIGQETGIVGLGLFLAINALLARQLWLRRRDPLALGLLAGLAGISFVGLLSHVWADDTLAYIFWGLAGITLGTPRPKP